jgi:type IV secretory pathway VirB2 component (pilin)
MVWLITFFVGVALVFLLMRALNWIGLWDWFNQELSVLGFTGDIVAGFGTLFIILSFWCLILGRLDWLVLLVLVFLLFLLFFAGILLILGLVKKLWSCEQHFSTKIMIRLLLIFGLVFGYMIAIFDTNKWHHKVAEWGFVQTQFNLGRKYALGDGITRDDLKAIKWLHKAAERGHTDARMFLARRYNYWKTQAQPQSKPKKVSSNPTEEKKQSTVTDSSCPENQYALTVNATPPTSRIRIMNIRPKYQAGICLKPRKYDIYVTHQGYHSSRKWTAVQETDVTIHVTLTPLTD